METRTQSEAAAGQKRRSDRISLRIPLDIQGRDQRGQEFSGRAVTQMVSRFGASIVTKLSLASEQELTLIPGEKRALRARIIGQTSIGPDGNVYGIAFLNSTIDSWGIYFPPLADAVSFNTDLECGKCKTRQSVALSGLEYEVFRANERMRRICPGCGEITTWYVADDVPTSQAPPPAADLQPEAQPRGEASVPVTGAAAQRYARQRRYPRVRVNMKACIAQPGSDDDIVSTINISRGGVLVRSERVYPTESWIQVAVPYTPAGANIFVPARIVRRADVQGAYEYGIKYVRG